MGEGTAAMTRSVVVVSERAAVSGIVPVVVDSKVLAVGAGFASRRWRFVSVAACSRSCSNMGSAIHRGVCQSHQRWGSGRSYSAIKSAARFRK